MEKNKYKGSPRQFEDAMDFLMTHEYVDCEECGGEGQIIVCIDDICHGLKRCIHGDGMMACPACDGNGGHWVEEDGEDG